MIYFAHNEVTHVDATESVTHILPQILGVVLVAVVLLYVIARALSRSNDTSEKDNEA